MPSGREHISIAQVTGSTAGAVQALMARQPLHLAAVETVGALASATVMGQLPDRLDPPSTGGSYHRGAGHSYATAAALGALHVNAANATADTCREIAKVCFEFGHAGGDFERILGIVSGIGWTLLAGAANGAIPGYVSHLAADAATPRGLPLLGNSRDISLPWWPQSQPRRASRS